MKLLVSSVASSKTPLTKGLRAQARATALGPFFIFSCYRNRRRCEGRFGNAKAREQGPRASGASN